MKPNNGGLIATLVATLMLAACTPTEPDDQATSTPGGISESSSAASRPVAENRDERAVFATLLRIDPCALLKSAASALPGYPQQVQLRPSGPTRCSVSSADHAGGVRMWVDELSTNQRRGMRLTSLGGAKAYVERTAVCKVYLPVSFTYALAFLTDGFPGENQCPTGEQFVEAAATTLAHPETVWAELRWDTCDLLRTAIGDETGNYRRDQVTVLDDCAEDKSAAWLYFDYGTPGVDTDHVKYTRDVVGNTTVWRYELADGCRVEWQAGPPRHQSEVGLRALVRLPTCEGAKQLAGSVMTLLTQPPPNDVAPQQPLLYTPDEPDMPG
jgi:hypothetical protein